MFGVCSITKLLVTIGTITVAVLAIILWSFVNQLGQIFGSGGTTLEDSARHSITKGLMNVKIDERDVTEVQRQAQMELMDKWDESFKINEEKGISTKNVKKFLDHVQGAYEGVDDEMRTKMESISYVKNWEEKSFKFDCDERRNCQARYAVMAFGRSSDKKSIDFIYAYYKLDFRVAPKIIEIRKQNSLLWGLYNWESRDYRVEEHNLGAKAVKQLRNFVRYRVMEGFYNEGYIDTLNRANYIEDQSDNDEDNDW